MGYCKQPGKNEHTDKRSTNQSFKTVYFLCLRVKINYHALLLLLFLKNRCHPAWHLGSTKSGPWDRVTRISPCMYKKNWRLIAPIQEECLSFKQHPSRCMLSQHNYVTLSLDRPIFYFLAKQFFCQTTCSLCSSVSDAFC